MILTDLLLNNFQIHKELLLEFTQGVNVLIGESDAGKSAVVRSLDLLIRNQPKGGEQLYQNDKTEEPLRIELHDSDGNVVIRENRTYEINGKSLGTFGTTIPEPLAELLPFKDINFQFQLDPYFLVLETGGKAAEVINKATGLGDQELVLSIIKKQTSESRHLLKTLIKQKEATFNKIDELRNVPHFLMKAKAILNLETEYNEINETIGKIEQECIDLSMVEEELAKYTNLDIYKKDLEKICVAELEYRENFKLLTDLKIKTAKLNSLESDYKIFKKVNKYSTTINEILGLVKEHNEINDGKVHLFQSINDLKTLEAKWMREEMKIDDLKLKLEDSLKSFGKCPLCGSDLKGKTLWKS